MSESEAKPGIDARLEAIDSNLKFVGGQQRNILSALSMILDTLRAQGKMLQQLTTLAREEPASSPLVQSLDDLTGAVTTMDETIQHMAGLLDGLPKAISTELARGGEPAVPAGDRC